MMYYCILLTRRKGMGRQVKKAVMKRKIFRPHTSESAPISGAERKLRKPFTPMITPFMIRASLWGRSRLCIQVGNRVDAVVMGSRCNGQLM